MYATRNEAPARTLPGTQITARESETILKEHAAQADVLWSLLQRVRALKTAIVGNEPEPGGPVGEKVPPPSGFLPELDATLQARRAALAEIDGVLANLEQRFVGESR